ncbi:MAG TPA: proline--tRNA ligase [Acidimicrobiia bacterium]|nr:proline--tRNA ligase [Acidimicrobiia bacterium]
MRWSHAFIPTLRDDPAGAEATSHRLLVRAGFIRQLSAGHYSMLPLGQRTRLKVTAIVRREMNRIGGQEVVLPTLHPAEIWRQSGRFDLMGENLFKLVDRRGMDNVLGMTEEELFAILATELSSYRQLPQIWYQIHSKYRDEPRPKSGLLRVREFTMKDAYTLDVDRAGLDRGFDKMHAAYLRIFASLGLEAVDVEASSGAMGGSESVEFMVASDAGEDWIVTCPNCDYRANLERAVSRLDAVDDGERGAAPARLSTPGIRTIAGLAEAHPDVADPVRQLKTLVYVVDGVTTLAVLRGDHDLQDQKLLDATKAAAARPAQPDEVQAALGALPGSLGAVGVTDHPVLVDESLRGRFNMVTGANDDDWHLTAVDVDRDLGPDVTYADLREVKAGEPCPKCGTALEMWKGIEVGHIFKLGTKFSVAFEATVQDDAGDSHPIIMGSYGIGIERNMAAVVEASHDERGIIWPVAIAPYEVVVTLLRPDDVAASSAAEDLYKQLEAAGVEVILDDRAERPGVKFADSELIGIPWRITVGPRGVEAGTVEVTERATMETREVAIDSVADEVAGLVAAAKSA